MSTVTDNLKTTVQGVRCIFLSRSIHSFLHSPPKYPWCLKMSVILPLVLKST